MATQFLLRLFVSPLTRLEIATNADPGRRFTADATSLSPGLVCIAHSGQRREGFFVGRRGVHKMLVSPYAGGIKAISRWLSGATPPELIASTIFESRRDSRLIRRFGVVSTMSLRGRVRSGWDRSVSTTSVPVASLALSHRLIADVLPGRQARRGTPVFLAKKSFTALPFRAK